MANLPNCRAINDRVLALARDIKPDIVVLHGTWEKYLDNVAETVTALKQQTHARVVVLGATPEWKRGLPNEVLRYFMLYHRLIPPRSRCRLVQLVRCGDARQAGTFRRGIHFGMGRDVQCRRLYDADRGYRRGYFRQRSGAPDGKRIGISDSRHHRPVARRGARA